MSKRFLKGGSKYISIDDIASVEDVHSYANGCNNEYRADICMKSGVHYQLPAGIPAKYIVEMLIQGEVIDVAKEWELSNTEGF